MSPVRPRARAMLSLLGGLGPQLLLLLLRPPAASGDCSLPPDVPNAQATLGGLTSFPEKRTVTYKCNRGFVKVPGKADSVVCQNNKWSELAEFCNRSCDVPTRLLFASLKKSYSQQNYFPEGTTVEYECRQGYIRDPSLSGNITCLQNFVWSKPDRFCKKKSCPKPREIDNGHVNITTDILLGATIYFSCNAGYKLVGAASSFCAPVGNTVGWTDEFPECQETDVIPTVPKSTEVNVPGTKVLSTPQKPTTVNVSATETPPTPQKPTTVNVSATETPPTPQKPTTVNVSATETPPTPQKPTTVNVPTTETPPTPEKFITINSSATKAPLVSQTYTTVNVPATKVPSPPQKPSTANGSATTAWNSPISNTVSTAAQNLLMANASETTPTTQRFTPAKSLLTQNLKTTQKSTSVHTTKGLRITQRLTSARVTAAKSTAVPRTTPRFHATGTPKGRGSAPSVASTVASGCVAVTVIIGIIILVKIFWDSGKSGSYHTHENTKALKFHDSL
ncbi:complement decay-accelerating factor isoform X8 [Bubalus bubalis]|uniref:complement decay-accelerating factor isoform X8 n=1 Tax=Bubalus bubalis TaxID=89462 RepID=UPI001E1B95DA|nr:complement decay-accelerating factor isoform X8 [Bubalus bubalis]